MRLLLMFFCLNAFAQEYEVLPYKGGGPRGALTLSDGPAYISGGSTAFANRFRLGARLELGADHRFQLGWTIIDSFSGGEKSREVGGVTRSGSGFVLGYDILPDRLCLNYTFNIHTIRGGRVTGSVTTYGHQFGVKQRVYSGRQFNLGAELNYLLVPEVSVPLFDVSANATQSATFPSANIVSLSLVMDLNFD